MISNKNTISFFRLLTDLAVLNIVFILSAIFAQSWEILIERQYMFILLFIANVLWGITSKATKLNDEIAGRSFIAQAIKLFNNLFIQIIIFIFFIFIVKEDLFTRNFIFYFSAGSFVIILLKEYAFQFLITKARAKGINLRNVIIVGNNETGINFKQSIIDEPQYGYKFLGFVDNSFEENTISKIEDLENFIKENKVDEVIIALDVKEFKTIQKVLRICDKLAVKSFIIPDYFQLLSNKFQFDILGNYPVISVRNNPLEEFHWKILKRVADFTISSILFLLFFWWIFLIIAVIIKLTSKGPVFFIQERVGKNNEIFNCYKFRTMTLEASSQKDANIPVTDTDSRITKIGKFLRASNMDETPQIINVIKGEMSIVGPRPHAIPFDRDYGEIVDEIRLRHRVSPGITGWAQIHGLRGDVFELEEQIARTKKRIEHDIWYIENWSPKLDLQIIFETFWQIIRGKNKGK